MVTLSLECLRLVLTWPDISKPEHRPTLQAFLLAFGGEPEEEEGAAEGEGKQLQGRPARKLAVYCTQVEACRSS